MTADEYYGETVLGVSVENIFPSDADADAEDTLHKYAPER